jgi:ferredoxin
MKKYNIYYFTGTGNSLFVARELSKYIDSTINSIPHVLTRLNNENMGLNIIIVYPSYLALVYGLPVIVKDFVENIPDLSSRKIFAVCSCGGYEIVNAVPSIKSIERIIKTNGGKIFKSYTLRLPMNNLDYDHIPIPIEQDNEKIINVAKKKIIEIAKDLQRTKREYFKRIINEILLVLMTPLFIIVRKISYKTILKIAKEPEGTQKSIENILRLTDRSISIDEKCIGCNICVKVCPVNNIKIKEKLPIWLNHCEMCFACHEWCPEKAVHHWGRKEGIYYHHPEVTIQDFLTNET